MWVGGWPGRCLSLIQITQTTSAAPPLSQAEFKQTSFPLACSPHLPASMPAMDGMLIAWPRLPH